MVAVGVAGSRPDEALDRRLLAIAEAADYWMDTHRPEVVAVERVFSQLNVSTVMGTAQASGVVIAAAARRGIRVALHTPTEVKAAVTGHGGADKAAVTKMVTKILRLEEEPKPADAADALALAITHAWRSGGTPTSGGAGSPTSAQLAWAAAEAQAKRAKGPSRR